MSYFVEHGYLYSEDIITMYLLKQIFLHLFEVHLAVLILAQAHLLNIFHLIEHLVLSSKWELKYIILKIVCDWFPAVLLEKSCSQVHFYSNNLFWIFPNNSILVHALDTITSVTFLADTLEEVESPEWSVKPAVSISITGRNMPAVSHNTVTVVLVLP